MNEIWQDCLFPIMLGSGTVCHACVRQMSRRLGVESTVVTGRRALTLRFLPGVHLISAPPTLPDDILLNILAIMILMLFWHRVETKLMKKWQIF